MDISKNLLSRQQATSNYVLPFKIACATANLSTSTMRRLIQAGHGPRLIKLSERRIGIRCCGLEDWLAARCL